MSETTQPAADTATTAVPAAVDETAVVASDEPGMTGIATWSAPDATATGQVPISPRTGEPTRVWTIWTAAAASYLSAAVVGVATLVIYWNAAVTGALVLDESSGEWTYHYDDSRFGQASWLMGQFDTEPGSAERVLLAVAVTVIALLISAACAITGYYAYDGRRWTRWSGLIALALSAMTLMLNPLAWAAIGLAAIAAVALWLPPSARYFATWQAVRHHEPLFSPPPEQVLYGPLPKYR